MWDKRDSQVDCGKAIAAQNNILVGQLHGSECVGEVAGVVESFKVVLAAATVPEAPRRRPLFGTNFRTALSTSATSLT
jgi:hypothetical protein